MASSKIQRISPAESPRTWLVTGVAGFIGSNLLEALLRLGQYVVGLDNFATGHRRNLELVQKITSVEQWRNFRLMEGDICDLSTCRNALLGVDFVLHQAALGSVPRSFEDPIASNRANVDGFLNMLIACRDTGLARFVYAASSSTYGDHPDLPKIEQKIGRPLSPYAVTKYVNELYADVFGRTYKMDCIGLRYFNVFGPRQDPDGSYAAVIPKWTTGMLRRDPVFINGDGETTRDFCYVANAVQANLLAATVQDPDGLNQVYNIAGGERTSLNVLHQRLRSGLQLHLPHLEIPAPYHRDFRGGDVRHSLADISKAKRLLGYNPSHTVDEGIKETMAWFVAHHGSRI